MGRRGRGILGVEMSEELFFERQRRLEKELREAILKTGEQDIVIARLKEAIGELLRVIDASTYGETSLHHHTCPFPDYGKCSCGANQAVDDARAMLLKGKVKE